MRFFHALCQANPIGIRSIVPQRDAAPGELLLLELRRGIRRPLSGERGYERVANGDDRIWMAAGACIRAAPASRSG